MTFAFKNKKTNIFFRVSGKAATRKTCLKKTAFPLVAVCCLENEGNKFMANIGTPPVMDKINTHSMGGVRS